MYLEHLEISYSVLCHSKLIGSELVLRCTVIQFSDTLEKHMAVFTQYNTDTNYLTQLKKKKILEQLKISTNGCEFILLVPIKYLLVSRSFSKQAK